MAVAYHKPWSAEEDELLAELWGHKSLPKIAKTLQRSESAILIKVHRFELGAFLENGDYITLNQLVRAVTGSKTSYSYQTISWVQKRGLPIKMRRVNNDRFRVVYLDDFWKWAEENRDFLDFSKFEENSLGIEPKWVKAQRKSDFQSGYLCRKTPWTPQEDRLLKGYLTEYQYSYDELSRLVHRTCGAIQRRICDLGLKERPIKADNMVKWTDAELALLLSGIRSGQSYELLSVAIGKSSKAIRGKVSATYKTESLDAVRKMIVDSFWGSGAPIPTVNQAKRTAAVKTDLAKLAGLLLYQRNQMGIDGKGKGESQWALM